MSLIGAGRNAAGAGYCHPTCAVEKLRSANPAGPSRMQDLDDRALPDLLDSKLLQSSCGQIHFEPGAVLRRKGHHYRDMYLITHGSVEVDRGNDRGATKRVNSGAGSPIGEIAFLRGSAASATVTA